MDLVAVVLLVIALAVGGVCGYLVAHSRVGARGARASADIAALTTRLEAADRELTTARAGFAERLTEVSGAGEAAVRQAREDAAARERDADSRHRRELAEAEERHAAAVERLESAAVAERERLVADAEAQRARIAAEAEKRVSELRADTKRLGDEFDALAQKALAANNAAFLAQAEERLKRSQAEQSAELAKREEAVKSIVTPLERTLSQVKEEVTAAERSRLQAHTQIAEAVKGMQASSDQLRAETTALVTALRAPQVRGQWGEMQLRRTVEAAGMVEHVDFEEQVRVDGGAQRPDVVVHLPGDKQIVVDAKVAFNGYLEAMEARDEKIRAERLTAHARHLRTHVDQLAGKEYWAQFHGSPELTVMFVPSDVFLDAALKEDATLQEHALSKGVILATPSTLVALLRTVAITWRQEQLAKEAAQVFTVGRELHKRLATFGAHLDAVAKRLNSTVESFNKMTASLDSRVVPQLQRFSSLQGLEPAIESPSPLEVLATAPQKPDLYQVQGARAASEDAVDTADETASTPGGRESAPDDEGALLTALAERAAVLDGSTTEDDLLTGLAYPDTSAETVAETSGSSHRKRA